MCSRLPLHLLSQREIFKNVVPNWIFWMHKNALIFFVPKSGYHANASVAVQKLKIIIDFLPQNHHFSHEFSGPDVTQTPTPLQKLRFPMTMYWSPRTYKCDLRNLRFRKGAGQKEEFIDKI